MNSQQCPVELQPFLQRLSDPAEDGFDHAALENVLMKSKAARHYYSEYMGLHAQLQLLAESPLTSPLSASGSESRTASDDDSVQLRNSNSLRTVFKALTRPRVSVLLALFTISLGLAILAFVEAPNLRATAGPPVAELKSLHECVWVEGASPLPERTELPPGTVLKLLSGQAEIAFGNVAQVVVIGPAQLVIDSAGSCTLESGKAVAEVPDSATGFTIHTPTATVVDFGTRFAVAVNERKETEVHVFEGEVAVQPRGDRDEGFQGGVRHFTAGMAVHVAQDNSLSDIECRPGRFVRRTPNVTVVYAHQGGGLLRSDGRVVLGGNPHGVRRIGSSSESDIALVSLLMFRLPEIPAASAIESARLAFTYKSMDGSAEFDVDLYGLGYVPSATIDPIWFFEGSADRDEAQPVAEAVLSPSTPAGKVIVQAPSLADFLAGLYRDGAQSGDLAVFRLSASESTQQITRMTGYNVVHAPVVTGQTEPHEVATLSIVLHDRIANTASPNVP